MRYLEHIETPGVVTLRIAVRRRWWPWSWRTETWVWNGEKMVVGHYQWPISRTGWVKDRTYNCWRRESDGVIADEPLAERLSSFVAIAQARTKQLDALMEDSNVTPMRKRAK